MNSPHIPTYSASTPDDDPTGVRALLSGLPEPDPMPDHLVERINASLTAAQAQRAASSSGVSVTPLFPGRHRPGRVLFAIAGAAAAVALLGVVGTNLFKTTAPEGSGASAAAAITSSSREATAGRPPATLDKAAPNGPSTPPLIQISLSATRYTRASFTAQARALGGVAPDSGQRMVAPESPGLGSMGTTLGLTDCLRAIGASGAQRVRADIAFYEGAPAVIIVATTDGIPMAYAVGRECSLADAALLRPATSLH